MFGRYRIKGPTIRGSIAGLWMIRCTVTGCAFPILFHPLYVFGGLWLAVGVSAGTFLHPLAGFLLAIGGYRHAGGGYCSGSGYILQMVIIQGVDVMALEGFLTTQTGQSFQMVGPGGGVGGLEHVVIDVHAQLTHVSATSDETVSNHIA